MASSHQTLWDIKRRVEADNPDFPHLDLSSPDFDLFSYGNRVQDLLREAGIPLNPYAVTWNNLTCSVPLEPPQLAIATVVSGFRTIASSINNGFANIFSKTEKDTEPIEADILHQVSGYLKPREMCLVLGQSGSGTSLLLNRIAGRDLPRLINTSGSVLYQGEKKLAGIARPSHFIHFIGQDDTHIPELTVRHTLEFSAACNWPAWVPHVETLRRNDVVLTARILGIERTLETIVGSNVLRGVSGGERKRVTIGEMGIGLVGGTLVMDNWSKGLDSATTLSITQSMRKFADSMDGSVIVSMQAPGSEAFNVFDNLCILHKGLTIYFGPVSKAEEYFTNLGFTRPAHRTVADFVSTLMDPQFRGEYIQAGNSKGPHPPETAEEFASCYENSPLAGKVKQTIEELNNQPKITLPAGSEAIAKRGKKPNIQSPRFQIKAMMSRQKNYLLSTRQTVVQDFIQNILFGIILGSIFWQLPNNQSGANSRDGVIFLALLFIGLGSLSKVDQRFAEKVVFTKQNNAGFFEAWTYLFTQSIFDLAIELIKSICLLIPLYLMGGLNIGDSGQRLLYGILLATFMSLTMLSMTRIFAALLDDAEAAQGAAGLFTILMVLFSGYLKNGSDLEGWLVWIYWINPIHYALEALLINEFDGLQFSCDVDELLPSVDAFPKNFRICTVSDGNAYLSNFRGITNDEKFRLYYFLVVVGFNVLFFLISAVATTYSRPTGYAKKGETDTTELLDEGIPVDVSDPKLEANRTSFTFQDLNYAVEDGSKVLLPGVSGNAVSGKVVLLIGTSGAGKSTLLDVCAMRKTLGSGTTLSGEIRLNGKTVGKEELSHSTGYCEQNDMHVGEATVYEAVLFSAKLRLSNSISLEEKKRRTMETISLLNLESYSSLLVKSLGAGELKLLTMALEVVANPKVLFLDEPTSGISSSSAIVVAKALRKIADSGTAVICTLHQPSAEVFSKFDRVLLLRKGGKTVYFGDIGHNALVMRQYFESRGAPTMKQDENPASWMLDVINDDSVDWHDLWNESDEKKAREDETQALANPSNMTDTTNDENDLSHFDAPPLSAQVKEVISRQFWVYWRKPSYNGTRVILNLMIAILVGLLFLREVDDTQDGANLAFGALFLTIIPASLASQNVIPTTMEGRDVFYREIASGTYNPLAYHAAVGIVELPFTIFSTSVFAVVFYFMVGLDPARFGYFFLAIQLLYIMAVNFGIMLASILPNVALATNIENSVFSMLQVLSGFFILKPDLRPWWKWTVWINPFSYYLSGLVSNQFAGQKFTCVGDALEAPRPPSFATCEEIPNDDGVTGDFFPPSDVNKDTCLFCPTQDGEDVIERYGAGDVNKWLGLLAIGVVILVFRIVAGYGFTKKRFLTR